MTTLPEATQPIPREFAPWLHQLAHEDDRPSPEVKLSRRETQVAKLISGEGCTNKEIGFRTNMSTNLVKQYVYSAMRKTGAKNRTELAIWVRDRK
jgi:DNA-binding NarL/FixJ family response regulator